MISRGSVSAAMTMSSACPRFRALVAEKKKKKRVSLLLLLATAARILQPSCVLQGRAEGGRRGERRGALTLVGALAELLKVRGLLHEVEQRGGGGGVGLGEDLGLVGLRTRTSAEGQRAGERKQENESRRTVANHGEEKRKRKKSETKKTTKPQHKDSKT